ncbi:MAG: CpaF family protein [Candidatus Aenigmarchaeota archaeon]|nr:CpaF family protein [Candidatus Aenigmarchaeota archaeon]
MKKEDVAQKYVVTADGIAADVNIGFAPGEFVPIYRVRYPKIEIATRAILEAIREKLISEIDIRPSQTLVPEEIEAMKARFFAASKQHIKRELPKTPADKQDVLAGILLHNSLGLGPIEILLNDQNLEEIVINSAREPVWVYHRKLGWLKTDITLPSETEIYNYAAMIGRRVGTQITYLTPLMDAYLTTGDRANATLFPISSQGNTLTIRKFARRPWTITDFIEANTLSVKVAAFLWLGLQYEMNVLIAGGTASGKTSLLNVLSNFIPPNQRIISIEDTREVQLPDFLHWVPLTTRPANPEGKGEVSMLELMVNSLRMRPDRILVGEIRRSREAEVLFEAIHTGHSVYSTLHANTAEETVRRLTHPPINIPVTLLSSLQLVAVMHRDRRREIRRVIQVSEIMSGPQLELNTVFEWLPTKDTFMEVSKSSRVMDEIGMYTGMTRDDLARDLRNKEKILTWLVKKQVKDINRVGKIISTYYLDPDKVLEAISTGKDLSL